MDNINIDNKINSLSKNINNNDTKMLCDPKSKNIGIELLRITCMAMVVFLHILGAGGMISGYADFSLGNNLVWEFKAINTVAVDCFALITGYVMVNSKCKISRLISLWVQVIFYSIIAVFMAIFVFHLNIGIKDILLALFPLTSKEYWYASSYMFLLFLIPIYNLLINNITKEQHKKINIILIIAFSLIPSIFVWSRNILGTGCDFVWLSVLYFVGAYIKKYDLKINHKLSLLYYFIIISISYVLKMTTLLLTTKVLGNGFGGSLFYANNAITVFLASVFLFDFFIRLNPKNSFIKQFAKLGKYVFGVYLIHNHGLISNALWDTLKVSEKIVSGTGRVIIYILIVFLSIFTLGVLVEKIRFELMNLMGWQKLCKWINEKTDNWMKS